MADFISEENRMLELIIDMMNIYGIANAQRKAHDLFLVSAGEVHYIAATHPDSLTNVEGVIGLESGKLNEDSFKQVKKHNESRMELIRLGSEVRGISFQIFQKWDQLCTSALQENKIPSEQDIQLILQLITDSRACAVAREGIDAVTKFLKNSRERDEIMGYRLKRFGGNIIVVVGQQHVKGIIEEFK